MIDREDVEIGCAVIGLTIAMFALGVLAEQQWIGARVYVVGEHQWQIGCKECGQFEKNACARDQLQGVRSEPTPIQ